MIRLTDQEDLNEEELLKSAIAMSLEEEEREMAMEEVCSVKGEVIQRKQLIKTGVNIKPNQSNFFPREVLIKLISFPLFVRGPVRRAKKSYPTPLHYGLSS